MSPTTGAERSTVISPTARPAAWLPAVSTRLAVNPADPAYHNNLGNVLSNLGRLEEAAGAIGHALEHQPDNPQVRNNMGIILRRLGRFDEAARHFQGAVTAKPDYVEAHSNFGNLLMDMERFDDAAATFRHALELNPGFAVAHGNLGNALKRGGRYQEAIASYRRALKIEPAFGDALNNLAEALKETGEVAEAIPLYRRALAQGKGDQGTGHATSLEGVHANLLFALNCLPDMDPAAVLAEHRAWAGRLAPPAQPARHDPQRRLRVGYVSADFRRHSVAYFIEPVLEHHDRSAFEVFCYANVARPDEVTDRLRGRAEHWRDIRIHDDGAAARMIRDDAIDILVDLGGHTMDSRLAVFARRPAPVQVTWLGYPNTTGLAGMDYRLTDAVADPEGTDAWHSERLVRLAGGFLCYRPRTDAPEVPPPEGSHGDAGRPVTFISCNNLAKVTPSVVETWAAILGRVPGSRMVLKAKGLYDDHTRSRVTDRFAAHGIAPDRIETRGWIVEGSPLAVYAGADVALDTFPYNGTTTTCESLWMGVPVVTLAGDRHAARVGASILGRLGLTDLVSATPAAYTECAVALAGDAERRQELRRDLRAMMAASGLTDGPAFTAKLEDAYRTMVRERCAAGAGGPGSRE